MSFQHKVIISSAYFGICWPFVIFPGNFGMYFLFFCTVLHAPVLCFASLLNSMGEVYQLSRYSIWPTLRKGCIMFQTMEPDIPKCLLSAIIVLFLAYTTISSTKLVKQSQRTKVLTPNLLHLEGMYCLSSSLPLKSMKCSSMTKL